MRKARKIQGLDYFSCQTFIQSRSTLFPSLEKEHIHLNFNVIFIALVDFVEEPTRFKILYTRESISLHVSSLVLDLQLISSIKAKFTLMTIHSHFTLVLYVKKIVVTVLYKKREKGIH